MASELESIRERIKLTKMVKQIEQKKLDEIPLKDREKELKQRQISYVIGRFASVSDMLDYVSPDSQLIRNIRDDVAKNPSKYGGISTNAFLKSYQNIFEIMNNICLIYNKTGNMPDKLFKQGFSAFNENLYNDLVAGKFSYKGFVHATVLMGNSLVPYYTPIKEGPNDERSC